MNADDFEIWMETEKVPPLSKRPRANYRSRCKRVERAFDVDLDEIYHQGEAYMLLSALEYIRQQKEDRLPKDCKLIFSPSASIYDGVSSLLSAVRAYFDYCSYRESE